MGTTSCHTGLIEVGGSPVLRSHWDAVAWNTGVGVGMAAGVSVGVLAGLS